MQGKIKDICRFVSQLANQTFPFTKLLKKDTTFRWRTNCQQAFEDLKTYLANPPILQPIVSTQPFLLYTTTSSHALATLLAQHNSEGKECLVYYISHTLLDYEV